MNGRNFSLLALVGFLTTLVLVSTFAGAGNQPPSGDATNSEPVAGAAPGPTWTRFVVRPVTVQADGTLAEAELAPAKKSLPPTWRAMYRFVRRQYDRPNIVLANYDAAPQPLVAGVRNTK